MSYKELTPELINSGVIFTQAKDVIKEFGLSKSTLWNHITQDYVDAYRWKNRTYFLPNDMDVYRNLHACGLLNGNSKPE